MYIFRALWTTLLTVLTSFRLSRRFSTLVICVCCMRVCSLSVRTQIPLVPALSMAWSALMSSAERSERRSAASFVSERYTTSVPFMKSCTRRSLMSCWRRGRSTEPGTPADERGEGRRGRRGQANEGGGGERSTS
jgi:hypothetical protein